MLFGHLAQLRIRALEHFTKPARQSPALPGERGSLHTGLAGRGDSRLPHFLLSTLLGLLVALVIVRGVEPQERRELGQPRPIRRVRQYPLHSLEEPLPSNSRLAAERKEHAHADHLRHRYRHVCR